MPKTKHTSSSSGESAQAPAAGNEVPAAFANAVPPTPPTEETSQDGGKGEGKDGGKSDQQPPERGVSPVTLAACGLPVAATIVGGALWSVSPLAAALVAAFVVIGGGLGLGGWAVHKNRKNNPDKTGKRGGAGRGRLPALRNPMSRNGSNQPGGAGRSGAPGRGGAGGWQAARSGAPGRGGASSSTRGTGPNGGSTSGSRNPLRRMLPGKGGKAGAASGGFGAGGVGSSPTRTGSNTARTPGAPGAGGGSGRPSSSSGSGGVLSRMRARMPGGGKNSTSSGGSSGSGRPGGSGGSGSAGGSGRPSGGSPAGGGSGSPSGPKGKRMGARVGGPKPSGSGGSRSGRTGGNGGSGSGGRRSGSGGGSGSPSGGGRTRRSGAPMGGTPSGGKPSSSKGGGQMHITDAGGSSAPGPRGGQSRKRSGKGPGWAGAASRWDTSNTTSGGGRPGKTTTAAASPPPAAAPATPRGKARRPRRRGGAAVGTDGGGAGLGVHEPRRARPRKWVDGAPQRKQREQAAPTGSGGVTGKLRGFNKVRDDIIDQPDTPTKKQDTGSTVRRTAPRDVDDAGFPFSMTGKNNTSSSSPKSSTSKSRKRDEVEVDDAGFPLAMTGAGAKSNTNTTRKKGQDEDMNAHDQSVLTGYANQVDQATPERLVTSLTSVANEVRTDGQGHSQKADDLQAEAAALSQRGMDESAADLRARAADHSETAAKRMQWAGAFDDRAAQVASHNGGK